MFQTIWHLVRGGSWFYRPTYARASYRDKRAPASRLEYIGFRCTRGLEWQRRRYRASLRSTRGGTWYHLGDDMRSSYRGEGFSLWHKIDCIGLRCARKVK